MILYRRFKAFHIWHVWNGFETTLGLVYYQMQKSSASLRNPPLTALNYRDRMRNRYADICRRMQSEKRIISQSKRY